MELSLALQELNLLDAFYIIQELCQASGQFAEFPALV
jgi:hypothetical protein